MIFKNIWILLFLPLIPAVFYILKKKDISSGLRFSSGELLKKRKPTWRTAAARRLIYFRMTALFLIVIALARPQGVSGETKIHTEGIDIVLAIDASGSMLAEDFMLGRIRQNRLEVVKKVVEEFIHRRKADRIGMIAFAGRAYTACPLTLDYDWLVKNLERVNIGSIEDGTAVGSAIASSLNRLKDTEAKSKIIILLTDGISNAGKISPLTAAEAAKAMGVKIYTIGVGTKGFVPYPVKTPWGETVYENVKIELDEETLTRIAGITGGKYFRATDTKSLEEIYREIDKLEKTPVEETGFQHFEELFPNFLIFAVIFLIMEMIMSNTIARKIP